MRQRSNASIRPRLLARGDCENPAANRRGSRALQFGHACLRVETPTNSPVNAAIPTASIRPRLLARGDSTRASDEVTNIRRFNSATPACAWRPPRAVPICSGVFTPASIRPRLLARGDSYCSLAAITAISASIRPRLLARGDSIIDQPKHSGLTTLQFGHACLRVETCGGDLDICRVRSRFNSATPACAWRLRYDD